MNEETRKQMIETAIRDGGVSFDTKSQVFIEKRDEWIFPCWPDITTVIPENRLEAALAEFTVKYKAQMNEDVYLGIWRDGSEYYIDLNAHAKTLDDAKRMKRAFESESNRKIISAYNPATDKTEYFE